MEKWAIPGAGAIIVSGEEDNQNILMQKRCKQDAQEEEGLLEIPAGKIREFESVYDTIRREVKEETGLDIIEILGESDSALFENADYRTLHFAPFSCTQNICGTYPIMVFVFICKAQGKLLKSSEEAKDFQWIDKQQLSYLVHNAPEKLYPMHVTTLRRFLMQWSVI